MLSTFGDIFTTDTCSRKAWNLNIGGKTLQQRIVHHEKQKRERVTTLIPRCRKELWEPNSPALNLLHLLTPWKKTSSKLFFFSFEKHAFLLSFCMNEESSRCKASRVSYRTDLEPSDRSFVPSFVTCSLRNNTEGGDLFFFPS